MNAQTFVPYTEKYDFPWSCGISCLCSLVIEVMFLMVIYINIYILFSLLPKVYTSYEGEVNPRLWYVLSEGPWVALLSQNYNEVCGECKGMAPRVFCFSSNTLHLGVPMPSSLTQQRAGEAVGSPAVDLPQHCCSSGSFIVHWLL